MECNPLTILHATMFEAYGMSQRELMVNIKKLATVLGSDADFRAFMQGSPEFKDRMQEFLSYTIPAQVQQILQVATPRKQRITQKGGANGKELFNKLYGLVLVIIALVSKFKTFTTIGGITVTTKPNELLWTTALVMMVAYILTFAAKRTKITLQDISGLLRSKSTALTNQTISRSKPKQVAVFSDVQQDQQPQQTQSKSKQRQSRTVVRRKTMGASRQTKSKSDIPPPPQGKVKLIDYLQTHYGVSFYERKGTKEAANRAKTNKQWSKDKLTAIAQSLHYGIPPSGFEIDLDSKTVKEL